MQNLLPVSLYESSKTGINKQTKPDRALKVGDSLLIMGDRALKHLYTSIFRHT